MGAQVPRVEAGMVLMPWTGDRHRGQLSYREQGVQEGEYRVYWEEHVWPRWQAAPKPNPDPNPDGRRDVVRPAFSLSRDGCRSMGSSVARRSFGPRCLGVMSPHHSGIARVSVGACIVNSPYAHRIFYGWTA
jgi:hypothetical protein